MSLYEFYMAYIFTRKAVFLSSLLNPLNVSLSGSDICIQLASSPNSKPLSIPNHLPVTCLSKHGIKIFLLTDPVHVSASVLTGVISIPVPEPDELPF